MHAVRLTRFVPTAAALAVALTVGLAATAGAEAGEPDVALAWYDGKTIDISDGFDGACAVHDHETVHCFDTVGELERHISDDSADTLDVGTQSACSDWLVLYSGTSFTGDAIAFSSSDTWFDLRDYGFDQRTSSLDNRSSCYGVLNDTPWGSGNSRWHLPETGYSTLGSWDNKARSVCLWHSGCQ